MKQRATAYELATLASRIDPERCASDPKEAIAAAERLLQEAEAAIEHAHQEEGRKDWEREEAQIPRVNWVDALKEITGQKRRDRAVERFLAYMEHEEPQFKKQVKLYKRDGFPANEMFAYQELFMNWLKEPKRKKVKQGRRISKRDGRLRIGSQKLF
jgi:hypothetical protein